MRRSLLVATLFALLLAADAGAQDSTVLRRQGGGFMVDFVNVPLQQVINALAEAGGLSVSASNIPNTPQTLKLPDPISAADIPSVLSQMVTQANLRMRVDSATGIYFIERNTAQPNQGRGGPAQNQATVEMGVFVIPLKHQNNELLAQILTAAFTTAGGGRGGALNLNLGGRNQNQGRAGGAAGGAAGGGAGGGRGGGGRGGGGGGDDQFIPDPALDLSSMATIDPALLYPNLALSGLYDPAQIRDYMEQQQRQPDVQRVISADGQVVIQPGGGGQAGAAVLGQLLGGQAAQALQALQQVQAAQGTDPRFVPMAGTNQLIIRATPADMQMIAAVIQAVDLRPLQVLIEVSIVEVRRNKDLNLGISGTGNYTKRGDTDPRVTGNLQRPATFDNARDFVMTLTGGRGTVDFDLALNALAVRGDVRISSVPIILAQNNRQAQLIVGEQRPFVQTTQLVPNDNGVVNQVVQYRNVATTLLITPTINSDGYVNLDVDQSVQDVTSEVQFDAPVISTRQAITSLFVRSGQTAVIGGMVSNQSDKTRSGIPFLSSIPILGHLFGATRESNVETELYVFLTPHVVPTDQDLDRLRDAIKANSDLIKGLDLRQIVPQPDTTIRVVIPPDTATVRRIPQRVDTLAGRRRDTLPSPAAPATSEETRSFAFAPARFDVPVAGVSKR